MSDSSQMDQRDGAEQTDQKVDRQFLVVGIGASAGGIRVLKEFFAQVPADSDMAYVVILHLSPEHESKLAEILQTVALIPVSQVQEENVKVEPNHVYVIPPNKSLVMNDCHLALSPVQSYEERRAPVDIFFRTLAESHDSRAVSVILSGTGADGSMGMKRVKEKGGIGIVQDPREAEYDGMPTSSIAAGLVDFVLPVREIPAQIIAYRDHLKSVRIAVAPEDQKKDESDETALREIFTQLRVKTGQDFSNYKRATVLRRIERRISVRELGSLPAYAKFMREQPDEAHILLKDLLISVTNFFRDRAPFEALEQNVLPKIFHGKTAQDQVRIWVAGCATGEEAYSLAMLCHERTMNGLDAPAVQIFATDIDEAAIAAARDGFYTNSDVADVSPDRLRKFFVKEGTGFRVRRELRETILFARHNVIKDPPFSHLDLATCRNLLIYLNRTAQTRVMETFHFALDPGGYLFLGSSETADDTGDLYATVDRESCIFQSRAVASRPVLPAPETAPIFRVPEPRAISPQTHELRALERMSLAALHQHVLELYAPPSILVNAEYDIVHLSEHAGRYLQIAGGEPSYNLLKVARPELRMELRAALYQALQSRVAVYANGKSVGIDDRDEAVNIIVRPVINETAAGRGFLLVMFERAEMDAPGGEPAMQTVGLAEPIAVQLEEELVRLKAQLRSTTEQYEVQTEELKASNEELQAINEELRSAAEELETGKEELQSVNEELTTVNQELKIKVEELSQSNNDFHNLINSTDIGTIFLDRTFGVNLFTPAAREIFNLIPADYGRPLSDITHHLADADLFRDAELVLQKLQPVGREVDTTDGRTFLMRISPYRTAEHRISGVILTFVNITARKRMEEQLRCSEERFRTLISKGADMITVSDRDGKIIYASPTTERVAGYTPEEFMRQHPFDLIHPEDRPRCEEELRKLVDSPGVSVTVQHRIKHKAGTWRWVEGTLTSLFHDGAVGGLLANVRDITERKQTEELLRRSEERLRLTMESAADYAIITTDTKDVIESWNVGAERIFGYTQAEATGHSYVILFTPEDRERGVPAEEMRQALEKGRAADERWHVRKDNSRFYVSGIVSPLRADGGALIGYVKILRDLTEQRRAEEELRRAHEELEARVRERTYELALVNESLRTEIIERTQAEEARVRLLRQLVGTIEDERRRIARDLHDHLGQQMTALRLNLELLKEHCGEDAKLCERIMQTQEIAGRLDADVDFLAWELRPAVLDDLGLTVALTNYVQEWAHHFKIPAEFHTAGLDKDRLPPEIETNLYRIAQEALNNIYKHAGASRVDVLLERRDGSAVLIIEDDGVGFDPSEKVTANRALGLIGMRERVVLVGGTLEIESTPDEGTTLFARVPAQVLSHE